MKVYAVYKKYNNDFLYYAKSISGNKDIAFDLVQNAYVKALENEDTFLSMNEYQIKGWFLTVIRNRSSLRNITFNGTISIKRFIKIIKKEFIGGINMSKIENVNILDIRNVKEDLAKEICQICNIGFLIESDDSQLLLKDCKKINVGANLKAPKDMEVVNYSGELEIIKEYMEGKITIRNMGKLIFEEDIDASEFEEKVLSIINYGLIIAQKKLIGIINSKLKENYGKVKSLEEANKNSKEHEKILYANLSELKL